MATKFIEAFARDTTRRAPVSLQDNVKLSPVAQRIVVSTLPGFEPGEVVASALDLFGNAVSFAPKTLYRANDPYRVIYTGIVVANTRSEPYSPETTSRLGLQCLSANVFEDGSGAIWKLSGEGDKARIVQVAAENLDAIVAARLTKHVVTADYDTSCPYEFGDFVAYFDTDANRVNYGYACSSSHVLPVGAQLTREVPETCVVTAVTAASMRAHDGGHDHIAPVRLDSAEMVKAGAIENAFLKYWSTLYREIPEYYEALKNEVSQYAEN